MGIDKKLHQWFLNESTSWMDVKLVSEINLSLNYYNDWFLFIRRMFNGWIGTNCQSIRLYSFNNNKFIESADQETCNFQQSMNYFKHLNIFI